MSKNLFAGKSTRTKTFTVISIIALVLVILLNLFVTNFVIYGNAYIDLTPEGLYTLRPVMVDACQEIFYTEDGKKRDDITITFCDDRDNLIANEYTRVVYYMAIALSKEFDNCKVEAYNIKNNPTAVAKYKTTSLSELTSTDVIVSYGSRYRIASAESFWRIGSSKVYSYDGEYKLASLLLSLTMVNRPVAYFLSDHKEDIYDTVNKNNPINETTGAFADLLYEKGFEIKTLSLEELAAKAKENGTTPKIPDDCVLLIINNPKEDLRTNPEEYNSFYYVSEAEMLNRYMVEERGSIMVAKDYKYELPNFEDFLSEWGIEYTNTLVKTGENTEEVNFVPEYNADSNSYAYTIYGDYVELDSAPRFFVGDTGRIICSYGESVGLNDPGNPNTSRIYAPFLYTPENSMDFAYDEVTGEYSAKWSKDPSKMTIAAISSRESIDTYTGEYTHSYLFCAASASFFSTEYLGNASFANYDVISSTIQDIAKLDTHADSSLGGISGNNDDESFLGKFLVETTISDTDEEKYEWNAEKKRYEIVKTIYGLTPSARIAYTVFIALVPISIAVLGIIVCIKRKFL